MRHPGFGWALAPFVLLSSACYDGGVICNAEGISSFSVAIRDSLSGVGLANQAITAVTEGAFSDTLYRGFDPDSVFQSGGVVERAGTYDVKITAAGYHAWTLSGVVVEDGECHVKTARLVAHLQPE